MTDQPKQFVDDVLQRLTVLEREAVRGKRFRDAYDAGKDIGLLAPRSLSRPIGTRGEAGDRVPDLATPLLARLRDDAGVSAFAAGSSYPMVYANGLVDPTFDSLTETFTSIGTSYTALGPEWEAKYVLNSGTVATARYGYKSVVRASTGYQMLSSGIGAIDLTFGVNASDMTIYLRPADTFLLATGINLTPSWLTAAIRAWTFSASNVTATAYMELVDSSDTVLASGDTDDLINLLDLLEHSRLEVGYEAPALNTGYRMRLRLDVTKTAGSAGSIVVLLAEPLITTADEGTPPAFTPAIGAWRPGAPGYQLVPRQYLDNNIAAGATTTLSIGAAGFPVRIPDIWGGSIVGISYRWLSAITGGDHDIDVNKNGTTVWTPISGGTSQSGYLDSPVGLLTFVSGDLLTVDVVTTGGFLPAGTNDLLVELWLLLDYVP